MEALNERIKRLRKEKGLTQNQLADQLGVTDKAVSKWEVGEANPDISLLVKMAQLFDVTVDYLLTGVSPEKEVVVSPKEMLIKTDDSKYLEKVSINDFDIVDMYKNKLVNVFTYLLDNNKINQYIKGKRGRAGNTNDYIPEILFLSLISNRLNQLNKFYFNDIGFADEKEWTDKMTAEFISDEHVNDETRDYVFSIHCRELISINQGYARNTDTYHKYGNWQFLYPKLLDAFAKAKNWKWVKKILDVVLSINEPAIAQFNEVKGVRYGDGNNYFLSFKPSNYSQVDKYIVVMEIYSGTLDTLLTEKQYELLDLANKINSLVNKPTITKKKIDIAKLDADNSMSEEDKFVKKCVYSHIININLLSSCDDLKLIRKILDNNYYHYYEYVHDLITKGNIKEAFEFLIDNNYDELSKYLFRGEEDHYSQFLRRSFKAFTSNPHNEDYAIHKALLENQNRIGLEGDPDEIYASKRGETTRKKFIKEHGEPEELASMPGNNSVIQHIKQLKENIYNSVVARQEAEKERERERKEREKIAKGLTKDYFENLLNSGKAESIKLFKLELCSLLDAIFIYDYHYEGEDFAARMNAHFKSLEAGLPQERQMDDGWGYMVPDTKYTEEVVEPERQRVAHLRDIFYRLRTLRNNILHPEKVKVEELSERELRECLEYVFAINKKVED